MTSKQQSICRESLRIPIFQTKGCVNCKQNFTYNNSFDFSGYSFEIEGNPENHSGHKTHKTHIV